MVIAASVGPMRACAAVLDVGDLVDVFPGGRDMREAEWKGDARYSADGGGDHRIQTRGAVSNLDPSMPSVGSKW
ncbi:hypothetical protein [Xanthomonas sp. NCPPB 1128]|uniref:hypothetical protein n=1 Tax=Xanthomonas sp. NCPPB 1128 TaxID=1775876 RepID=UPI000A6AB229|nr:hypothetical protein [Xanthomonas sp. NCPPB 1128]